MYRLLKILLVLLLVVIILEGAVYIYYFKFAQNGKKNDSLGQNVGRQPNTEQTRLVKEDRPPAPTQTPLGDTALDESTVQGILTSSLNMSKDIMKSYVVSVEVEGKISSIVVPTPRPLKDPNEHVLRFEIVITGDKGSNHTLRNSLDFATQKSFITVLGKDGEVLAMDNLNVGDKIHTKIDMDLTESKNGVTKYTWTIQKV